MSAQCGPSIPAHILAARKRKAEEEAAARNPKRSVSPDSKRTRVTGPSLPSGPSAPAGPSRSSGPSLPTNPHDSDSDSDCGPTLPVPARAPAGPAPPPAPLSERPSYPANSPSDSDSDSDCGPSLPPPRLSPGAEAREERAAQARLARYAPSTSTTDTSKPKRDEWMITPPVASDWTAKVDPTKLKARKFANAKTAASSAAGKMGNVWTETPDEKRKRLADEVMGVKSSATTVGKEEGAGERRMREEAEATARRIREYNEKERGETLLQRHKVTNTVEADDPSKRAFDREKDIAGVKVGEKQKAEMLKRATTFGDRFAKGSFL